MVLAGLQVVADGDPQLPDPCTQLALQSTHVSIVAVGCDRIGDNPVGCVAGQIRAGALAPALICTFFGGGGRI